jgi:hypothetical protein
MFRLIHSFIDGHWVKTGFAFFGTFSGPYGMDAVDHALATYLSMNTDNCLDLRAQEDRLLNEIDALNATRPTFSQIRLNLGQAWKHGYSKIMGSPYEVKAWEQANVFIIGGGSLVGPLRTFLSNHPNGQNITIPQRQLEVPFDLYLENGMTISASLLPFITVAYGLSNIGLAVPEAETPDSIPPVKTMTIQERLEREDIYG